MSKQSSDNFVVLQMWSRWVQTNLDIKNIIGITLNLFIKKYFSICHEPQSVRMVR